MRKVDKLVRVLKDIALRKEAKKESAAEFRLQIKELESERDSILLELEEEEKALLEAKANQILKEG